MSGSSTVGITQLLIDWSNGDKTALDKLMPLVYQELHRLAHHYMRKENVGHGLQTTALVNEAYLRLIDQKQVRWQNRAHFFAIASQIMRRILVDYVRKHLYAKRGGNVCHISIEEALTMSDEKTPDLVALDEALTSLAEVDPRRSRVVELRFFGGLTVEEAAEVLKVSSDTVLRDWSLAKAWLYRYMSNES
jgi:RNA polymerase sigma factor (TIGR02999 family)